LPLCAALLFAVAPALAEPDPLEPYRERFQLGLERFRAGDVHAAIQYWEAIRRQLGDEKAYRLMFNLGKAYEQLGDATLAAERYEVFLREADVAAQQGALDPAVQENVATARTRMEALAASHARIRVLASTRPGLVQVDQSEPRLGAFSAYVAPGKHTVTVDRDTPKQRSIAFALEAGQVVDVDPTRPADPPAEPASPPPTANPAPPAQPPTVPRVHEPPFPAYVIAVAGGVTVASLAVPWVARRHALGIRNDYEDPATGVDRRHELASDYDDAKTLYGLSWLVPVAFAGATGALTVWYLDGAPVTVEGGPTATGGDVRIGARF
jgi:tetratricopeptide (TPR) repeat protein